METQVNSFLSPAVMVAALIGFVIGALIFWVVGRKKEDDMPLINPLQKPYDELKAEYKAYRSKVNAHFSKTATAVDNLTKSYQEVFEHLSEGAQQLMEGEALNIEREKRQGKAVTLSYLSNIEARQSSVPTSTPSTTSKPEAMPKTAAPKMSDNKTESKAAVDAARITPRPAEANKPAAQPKSEALSEQTVQASAANKAQEAANKSAAAQAQAVKSEKSSGAPTRAASEKNSSLAVQVAQKTVASSHEATQEPQVAQAKPMDNQEAVQTAAEVNMPIEKPAGHLNEKQSAAAQASAAKSENAAVESVAKIKQTTAPMEEPLANIKRHLRDNESAQK